MSVGVPMSFDAMRIAGSGLRAAGDRLAVSAQNVANVDTDRYVPWRADAREEPTGGVRVTISRDARAVAEARGADPAPRSKTELADEAVYRSTARSAFRASLGVLRTAADLSAELFGGREAREREER